MAQSTDAFDSRSRMRPANEGQDTVNRDIGGLVLMAVYLGTAIVGEFGAYLIGRVVEPARRPGASLPS